VNPEERAKARKLCEAATPGPWEDHSDTIGEQIDADKDFASNAILIAKPDESDWQRRLIVGTFWHNGPQLACRAGDAAFIAAARTLVPKLLDALDEAEERIAVLERQRDEKATAQFDQAMIVKDLLKPRGGQHGK